MLRRRSMFDRETQMTQDQALERLRAAADAAQAARESGDDDRKMAALYRLFAAFAVARAVVVTP